MDSEQQAPMIEGELLLDNVKERKASTLNLASLPPDIIRRIVSMEVDSLRELRLIAPSWNAAVVDYLSRPHLGTLERVLLQCQERGHVRTIVLLPERLSAAVGVGGWLRFHKRHDESTIEAMSAAQPIVAERQLICARELAIFIAILCMAMALGVLNSAILGLLAVGLLAMLSIAYLWRKSARIPCRLPKLARFAAMFAHFDTLVLSGFGRPFGCKELAAVQASMGEVRINRLEVVERAVSDEMMTRIIDLCSKHQVLHVLIEARMLCSSNFNNFAQQLTQLGATVDILSKDLKQGIFAKPSAFWDKMAGELKTQGVSLRRVAEGAVPGYTGGYGSMIAHIRICRLSDDNGQWLFSAVQRSRGYARFYE